MPWLESGLTDRLLQNHRSQRERGRAAGGSIEAEWLARFRAHLVERDHHLERLNLSKEGRTPSEVSGTTARGKLHNCRRLPTSSLIGFGDQRRGAVGSVSSSSDLVRGYLQRERG